MDGSANAWRYDTFDKYGGAQLFSMGAMNVCSCGWTIVSPLGAEDVKMHTMIHLKEHHPGSKLTPDDILASIKQV